MVPLTYWCVRLVRRRLPQAAIEWMLDRGLFLRPGLDTRLPTRAVEQLAACCASHGLGLAGRNVCVVGYGGSPGIAIALLEAGAAQVVLQDPYAPVRASRIRRLDVRLLQRYFYERDGRWEPDPARIHIVRESLGAFADRHPATMDVIYSSSVLEHVDDVEGLVAACSRLTRAGGLNVHHIDLRDHFFRYPFEMLCYGRRTWQRWLNTSNLNRWRLPAYERVFAQNFARSTTTVTQALPAEFARTKHRIRKSFLTGDDRIDSAGTVRIEARRAA